VKHKNGQSRCRSAHLQAATGETADHDTADDASYQPKCRRNSASNGDAQAKRQGYEKNNDRGEEIVPQSALSCGGGNAEDPFNPAHRASLAQCSDETPGQTNTHAVRCAP